MRLNRIVLYVKDVERTVAFYRRYFGFRAEREEGDRIVELMSPDGGAHLMIHQAGKAQKASQSQVELVFDVENLERFCASCEKRGFPSAPCIKAMAMSSPMPATRPGTRYKSRAAPFARPDE